MNPQLLLQLAHAMVVVLIAVRVIMRRPAPGVALAWLFVVAVLPLAGAVTYLLVGERRVSQRRARRIAELRTSYARLSTLAIDARLTEVQWNEHPREAREMDRIGRETVGFPTVTGSSGRLFCDTHEILKAIVDDVDRARTSVLMEFYIWNEGGLADEVLDAVIRAAKRGLSCRVLVDALGGRPWWKSAQPARMREAGVLVQPALVVGPFRTLLGRGDLRLHRKIIVIDGDVAWTGSMNLVDPRYFKQNANVGQWIDAMVRTEGPVVSALAMTVAGDWKLETGEPIRDIVASAGLHLADRGSERVGSADVQVVPSGPAETSDGLLQMLLALIYSAREELVLTTPYFIPDESLLRALCGAARRGVRVDLIVPEKVDSFLTRHASRSYFDDLLDADIRVHLYRGGLLHTKSITADRRISMFGTVNFDMRSLWLNYEVALFVYGAGFAEDLRALQQRYIGDSEVLGPETWAQRPVGRRLLENALRLFSPIL